MMEVQASAPGKLVLLGDYAVLEGAPALVMAVNRHARVRIGPLAGGACEVMAPDLGLGPVRMQLGDDGTVAWQASAEDAGRLRLVEQTLRGLAQDGLLPPRGRGFALHLDTSGFFDQAAGGREKLGLGSSAALTVALASAMAVFAGRGAATANRRVWLERLLHLHREFQGGQGSGVDVAASLVGGLISYRLEAGAQPRFDPLAWPAGVQALFVWTGTSASTAGFLGRLAQWRKTHEREYGAHMRELGAIATAAIEAARGGRAGAFVEGAVRYADALALFGGACGLEIFSAPHRQLGALARECGAGYKPCGAGGGDFGVAFAQEPAALARAQSRIAQAGFRCVPLAVDDYGLSLEYKSF